MICDNSNYYRNPPVDGDPIRDVIEELQRAVEDINGQLPEIKDDITSVTELAENIKVHKHFSNVARFYCSTAGSDENDGSAGAPFRTLAPIFDPERNVVNLNDTAVKITFLTAGDFDCFTNRQEWPWFNGVFVRFTGPTRSTMPASGDDMPIVNFNCDAVSFSNSYLATDYVQIKVGTGEYSETLGEAYNRMHLNNTALICNCTYFNESRHAPHCGSGSYRDCVFNKFACTGFNAEFECNVAVTDNPYAIKCTVADSPLSPISCSTSVVRFNGEILLKQPTADLTQAAIVNKTGIMAVGENVTYYGSGSGKYRYGLVSGMSITMIRRTRYDALAAMGREGNSEAGSCLYVHNSTHLE